MSDFRTVVRNCVASWLLLVFTGCSQLRPHTEPGLEALRPSEGMWLPDALPAARLKKNFDFEVTQAWADHVRLSSVRVDGSGSAAFVSADGLVLTCNHVVVDAVASISPPGKDYVKDGFFANTRDQEIRLPGMRLSVLQSIQDVTARVNAAVPAGLPNEEAVKRRRAVVAEIENESTKATGLRSSVVGLFQGALLELYRYKTYDDVRIVFKPEDAIGFFGGDPDNFEYPRHDLDFALVRAYEGGKPAHVDHFLPLASSGVREGDLVIMSGHPGMTQRMTPAAGLVLQRDVWLPRGIKFGQRLLEAVERYATLGIEQRRQAEPLIFGLQNSLKAVLATKAMLDHSDVIERRQRQEAWLRQTAQERADLRELASAFDKIDIALAEGRRLGDRAQMINGFGTSLFQPAVNLVRLPVEDAKPNGERLPAYRDSNRAQLEKGLFDSERVYPELEIVQLTTSLEFMREMFGSEDATLRAVLQGKTPQQRARELVEGSRLADIAERRRLKEGGQAAIDASTDSMIRLAALVDAESRQLSEAMMRQVNEPMVRAGPDLAKLYLALAPGDSYPDATNTLRFAFGIVKGYDDGGPRPAWTTLGGAFTLERQKSGAAPWQLPPSWHAHQGELDLNTPFNFVSTLDGTGGNSGSPVTNREGKVVGVFFDNNRQGLNSDLGFTDVQARSIVVDVRAILETLRKVYGADSLVGELTATQAMRQ